MERLTEQIDFAGCDFVEAEDGKIVKNVVLLGPVSSHGYEYTQEAMGKAVKAGMYENVRIFINHASGERDVMHLAGVFRSSRHEGGKVKGDAHLLPDQYGEKFWHISRTAPEAASCSHVANGRIVAKGGKKYVEEISEVFSVDLVCKGATTSSVFEGEGETLEESLPKPGPKELQYQFIPRCIQEVKAANATLTDEEAGAMCFTVWQARYEPGGMMDTDPVPATATAKESSTINDSKIIESGPKPGKDNPMSEQHQSFIDGLTSKITEGKRIAQIAHPLAQDSVHAAIREDTDARIAARIAEKADTAAKVPEVLQKCRDIGDGLTFRESDAGFRTRWNDGLRLSEQREQDRETAKSIAANVATLGT